MGGQNDLQSADAGRGNSHPTFLRNHEKSRKSISHIHIITNPTISLEFG